MNTADTNATSETMNAQSDLRDIASKHDDLINHFTDGMYGSPSIEALADAFNISIGELQQRCFSQVPDIQKICMTYMMRFMHRAVVSEQLKTNALLRLYALSHDDTAREIESDRALERTRRACNDILRTRCDPLTMFRDSPQARACERLMRERRMNKAAQKQKAPSNGANAPNARVSTPTPLIDDMERLMRELSTGSHGPPADAGFAPASTSPIEPGSMSMPMPTAKSPPTPTPSRTGGSTSTSTSAPESALPVDRAGHRANPVTSSRPERSPVAARASSSVPSEQTSSLKSSLKNAPGDVRGDAQGAHSPPRSSRELHSEQISRRETVDDRPPVHRRTAQLEGRAAEAS